MIRDTRAQAIAVMEKYALTGVKPLPFFWLYEWYTDCKQPSKAQDALERGVAVREPSSVLKRVRCVMFRSIGSAYTHHHLRCARMQ